MFLFLISYFDDFSLLYDRLLSHIILNYLPLSTIISSHFYSLGSAIPIWTFAILYDVESIPNIISSLEIFVGIPVGHQRILSPVRIESSITTCRPTQVLGRIRWNSCIGIRAPREPPETGEVPGLHMKQPEILKGLYECI